MYLIPLYDSSHVYELDKINLPPKSEITLAFLFEGTNFDEEVEKISVKYCVKILTYDHISNLMSQTDVSNKSTELIKKIKCDGYFGKKISTLGNMLSLHIHPVVHLICIIDLLLEKGSFDIVVVFGCDKLTFNFPERVDVRKFYYSELSKGTLIKKYLIEKGVSYNSVRIESAIKVKSITILRRALLNSYKFYVTLKRRLCSGSIEKYIDGSEKKKNNVGVLIRAQSEYWTAKPMLAKIEELGYNPVIIQDDLIKNPSCKITLDNNGIKYIPIHSVVSVQKMIKIWIVSTISFFKANKEIQSTHNVFEYKDRIEKVFLDNEVAAKWIASSLHSIPELSVFEYEIKKLASIYDFKCLITMDMVDQWSAVIGDIGRELGIKTLTLQNTVLDDIVYPRPIATDYMAVSGEKVRDILMRSKALESQILNFGLPVYDEIYSKYEPHNRDYSKPFKVIIATQPFIQAYDYNKNLIEDVTSVLEDLSASAIVLIKPHPRENTELYLKMVGLLGPSSMVNVEVDCSDNILEMAQGCDLFVSRTSTALQSYILLGRLSLAYLNEYPVDICDRLDYLSGETCIKIYDKKGLSESLKNILSDYENNYAHFLNYRNAYINQYIGQFEGDSSDSICRTILS